MPRLEEEYIDIHNAADVLEPKLQRRALNGLRRVQQVSPTIDEIALVLASQPPLSASKIMSCQKV